MSPILMAIIVVTVIGLVGAVILVAASIFMYVPVDERVEKITAALPGANCGACGCAGCADYAKTIVEDGNAVNKCVPGGAKVAGEIAAIMGVEAGASVPMKAVVACSGTCGKTGKRFEFEGLHSCQAVKGLYGGDGDCKSGCLGYGDCVSVCAFDAIHVVDGVAKVDEDKCKACNQCVDICPRHIIALEPYKTKKHVTIPCSSKDKGPAVTKVCSNGCIGCSLCAKSCPKEAITMVNNLAVIDYEKCIGCGICAQKCPRKLITVDGKVPEVKPAAPKAAPAAAVKPAAPAAEKPAAEAAAAPKAEAPAEPKE